MHRLFCSSGAVEKERIIISDIALIHHFRDVLRIKAGEKIVACDEKGNEFNCIMEEFSLNKMVLAIKDKKYAVAEGKLKITAACAIPKNSRFDDIVDKLTQVGTDNIIPMLTERVIVKLDKTKASLRLQRWQKRALSAAEQSQRNALPQISPVKSFKQVLDESENYDLKLIPSLEGSRKKIKDVLSGFKAASVIFLIGPEGDFTPEELSLALSRGFVPVSLGEFVLRVETAAMVVASFIRLQYENS